jgi:hypothetical protein
MRSYFVCFMLLVSAICVSADSVHAGILLRYAGSTLPAGGSGFIDVFVSSDAVVGSPDVLDSFSAHFMITPLGGAPGSGLQFVDPQSDSQLGMGNYVFFGDSLTPPPLGLVSTVTNLNDTYIGGDATFSGAGVSLDSATAEKLLFRLDLSAALATSGSQYTLRLVNDGGTSFLDPSFGALILDSSAFAPITLTAVPEPATWCLAAVVTCGIAFRLHRRRMAELRAAAVD